jgi:hypothetical protein
MGASIILSAVAVPGKRAGEVATLKRGRVNAIRG